MAEKEKVCGFDTAEECPKSMLNGPCGGVRDGMCEVGGPCVWVKVYARLSSEGRLDEFTKVRVPQLK